MKKRLLLKCLMFLEILMPLVLPGNFEFKKIGHLIIPVVSCLYAVYPNDLQCIVI